MMKKARNAKGLSVALNEPMGLLSGTNQHGSLKLLERS
jgi:hypothetical protein